MPKVEREYRIIRTPTGPERHLVTLRDNKPISSKRVSDAAVLKDWARYKYDIGRGSISIDEIGE